MSHPSSRRPPNADDAPTSVLSGPAAGAEGRTVVNAGSAAGADRGGRARTWVLGERFMLRVAGLPIESVRSLRCAESSRWARAVLAEEARLGAMGSELSGPLSELVKATEDGTARRSVLALRREVFNNR